MIYQITDKLKIDYSSEIEKWRCDTFWTKEPETILWIERGMKNGGVFFDIGANIGIYTLYAASLYPDMKVYAFEPYEANFYALVKNAVLNGFKNVHPWRLALSDKVGEEKLFIKDIAIGSSGHQLKAPIDEHGDIYEEEAVETVRSEIIDNMVMRSILPHPNYIKIDVDGSERDIISGMMQTLSLAELESLLVEINHDVPDNGNIRDIIKLYGFNEENQYNALEYHSRNRRKGTESENAENVIFTREGCATHSSWYA